MQELDRFKKAQDKIYNQAFQEVKNGHKDSHWMWFIFPQIKGLGFSQIAKFYEIKSLQEAKAYLEDEILGKRLKEITNELLKLPENDPIEIFGDIDSLKLNSSMTLFDYVSTDDKIFYKVIEKYYGGKKDKTTLEICSIMINKTKIY